MEVEIERKEEYEPVEIVEYREGTKKVKRGKVRVITTLSVDIRSLKERVEKIRNETGKDLDSILEELGWAKYKEKIKGLLKKV